MTVRIIAAGKQLQRNGCKLSFDCCLSPDLYFNFIWKNISNETKLSNRAYVIIFTLVNFTLTRKKKIHKLELYMSVTSREFYRNG